VKLYIDETLVATLAGQAFFNRIRLGDSWAGTQSAIYSDDVIVE
jgi:hypothetical protein